MHLQIKMLEIGWINKFRDKQIIKKVPEMFLDVKLVTERWQLHYRILSKKKEDVAFKTLKVNTWIGQQWSET